LVLRRAGIFNRSPFGDLILLQTGAETGIFLTGWRKFSQIIIKIIGRRSGC
jgi:hypothetical protein